MEVKGNEVSLVVAIADEVLPAEAEAEEVPLVEAVAYVFPLEDEFPPEEAEAPADKVPPVKAESETLEILPLESVAILPMEAHVVSSDCAVIAAITCGVKSMTSISVTSDATKSKSVNTWRLYGAIPVFSKPCIATEG